jgi:hypothetical protein
MPDQVMHDSTTLKETIITKISIFLLESAIPVGRRAESGERRAESGERRAESGERRAESVAGAERPLVPFLLKRPLLTVNHCGIYRIKNALTFILLAMSLVICNLANCSFFKMCGI